MVGFHGAFLLLRPALFGLISAAEAVSDMAQRISQYVALESTVALVMIAFGTLLLTNEHVTTELRHLAEMDSLTNVFNRRAYLTLLDKAISNAQRTRQGCPCWRWTSTTSRKSTTPGAWRGTMCCASLWPWPSSACGRKM